MVKCSLWNVTSMINKTPMIMEHLIDRSPDIVFLNETWLKSDTSDITALLKTYGYKLVHNRRKNRAKETGGGVGVMLKLGMKYKHMPIKTYSSFELTVVKLFRNRGNPVLLVCVYRLLFVSVTIFLQEMVELFEYLATCPEDILFAGDINIHMDEDELYANRFKEILDSFNYIQHIDVPTHKMGHTLDVVATGEHGLHVSKFKVEEHNDVSHHFLIDFSLQFCPVEKVEKEIMYRRFRDMDSNKFVSDITENLHLSQDKSFGENVIEYNDTLRTIFNNHAPVKLKKVKMVEGSPWFDGEYENLRRLRRKA